MIAKRKNEIENLTKKIDSIKNIDETVKKRKTEIKNSIDILDGIIKDGAISNANLRLLISEIIILEQDNELSIVVAMKAPFGEYYGELFDEEGKQSLHIAVTIRVSHKRKSEQSMKSVPILVRIRGLEPP